jgi:hypothetical protein
MKLEKRNFGIICPPLDLTMKFDISFQVWKEMVQMVHQLEIDT